MTRYNMTMIAAAISTIVTAVFAGEDAVSSAPPAPVSDTTSASIPFEDTTSAQTESASVQVEDTTSAQTEPVSAQIDADTTSAQTESALILVETDPQPEPDATPEPERQPEPAPPSVMSRLGRPGRLDGIAAVVGGEIILHSEVEAFAFMRLSAMGGDPEQIDTQRLLRESLDELIDNKVLLVRAVEDSTINVRNDEVESTLNNHINSILRQNRITMEQFEELLRTQQGTTIARFRTEARRAIREQLYKQKLQQTVYFSMKVNRSDVERFFTQYADSLPEIGESFELLKLSLRLASSDSVRQAAHDQITAVKRRIDAGESFEDIAKELGDPSGGDLGYLVKGSTAEIAFEERAFNLPVGRVSEPFETRLGFHILLVEEKRDMRVKLRQIMVRHAPTEQQRETLVATLDSLRQAITSREEFEAAARAMSADPVTRARGGDMGWMSLLEMPPEVRNAVQGLEDGQISAPITEDNKLSVYMVNKRVDSRRLTLENDYTLIADKARDILAQKHLIESVKKWRERVFIDVRI